MGEDMDLQIRLRMPPTSRYTINFDEEQWRIIRDALRKQSLRQNKEQTTRMEETLPRLRFKESFTSENASKEE